MPKFDVTGDSEELRIDQEYYCYKCREKMVSLGNGQHKCRKCGCTFNENE